MTKAQLFKQIDQNMVKIKGGTFQMGSEDGRDYARPVHSVTLSDFEMGRYLVTNEAFVPFLNAVGNQEEGGVSWVELEGKYQNVDCGIQKQDDQFIVKPGHEGLPMIWISWYGATAFARWLSEKTNQNYRLPTEAQWEYAAKGGNKESPYPYAGSYRLDEIAWYRDNAHQSTKPVGLKLPNLLGLYDMSGNVLEWCADCCGPYSDSDQTNLKGPDAGTTRILRGGFWDDLPAYLRCIDRFDFHPHVSSFFFGFRLSRAAR